MLDSAVPTGAKASMEPAMLELGYVVSERTACADREVQEEREARVLSQVLSFPDSGSSQSEHPSNVAPSSTIRCSDKTVECEIGFDGEVLEVSLTSREPVVLESCKVVLRHAFASDELVLLNGYQSSTDTVERPAWSRMRGLRAVPKPLAKRYELDRDGDYALAGHTVRRGIRHGFTYATFRRGEGMVLVASLDEAQGFTLIKTDAAKGEVTLETECPLREVRAGERVALGRYVITRGTTRRCYDRWFELSQVRARNVKTLVGYTSWYRHYEDIDADKLAADLRGVRSFFDNWVTPYSAEVQKLFQIDGGYCIVGDWLDVDPVKFPQGLKPLADAARAAGFMPGIWFAPFVCGKDSRLFRERSEWLLRDSSGELISVESRWGEAYALDTRNVEARSYILEVVQTMTREWGFRLLKTDILYGACMYPHSGLNRGQLMADAVDLLRKGAGDDVLISGCGVPLGSAFGKLDYCRIGPGPGLGGEGVPRAKLPHHGRRQMKSPLGNTYARAPLDGRAFGIDPDVFSLSDDVKLADSHRDELLFANADLGRVLLTSDDMGSWGKAARDRFLQALKVVAERGADR